MITREALTRYLATQLAVDTFSDAAPNGLQIEGRPEIQRICTAVSASEACIQAAIAAKADALLVHHGYFWRGESPVLTGIKRQRIAHILAHDLNLFAYHLPLDVHLTWGNNACIARALGVETVTQYAAEGIVGLLWQGTFATPMTAETLTTHLEAHFKRTPLRLSKTDRLITSIAWCSGAAQGLLAQAAALGVDAYLSGEVSERTFDEAHEWGIHYFSCGHYATEQEGIQCLGTHLAQTFNLTHQFLPSCNPI